MPAVKLTTTRIPSILNYKPTDTRALIEEMNNNINESNERFNKIGARIGEHLEAAAGVRFPEKDNTHRYIVGAK